MTAIRVQHIAGRINFEQRRALAEKLTDAVLVVECGDLIEPARIGFQVYFQEFAADQVAIGGILASESSADILLVDIAVMDGYWPQSDRTSIIKRIYAALSEVLNVDTCPATWWINFRIIEDGSWGSGGRMIRMGDLLDMGMATPERSKLIRTALDKSS